MAVWVLIALVMVVGVKYYTATRMRDLERRLNRVKEGLHAKKDEYRAVISRQEEVQTEEDQHSERIRFMKELIHDIELRLQGQDQPKGKVILDAAPRPPIA